MENKKNEVSIIIILVLAAIVFIQLGRINNLQKINIELQDEVYVLTDLNDELYYTLDEANANIEQVNSSIEEAQIYTWETYEDMGYALENLELVETVDAPY